MIIRKLFKFEASHIVRGCSTERCRKNIHGHSFKVEVFLQCNQLDAAGMVLDFGLLKPEVKSFLDCFDHTHLIWKNDLPELVQAIKTFNERWISFSFSPTSETLALFFHYMIQKILDDKVYLNNEGKIKVQSVRVHETDTGYAQTETDEDLIEQMKYAQVEYSPGILNENMVWNSILENWKK